MQECIGRDSAAYEYVSAALKSGKHVVTPNKNLVAAYWDDYDLAREHGRNFHTASAGSVASCIAFQSRRQGEQRYFIYKRYR